MIKVATGRLLDYFDLGYCAFDAHDQALTWNMSFLKMFPEHSGLISVGEHYSDNLRRFYRSRLSGAELAQTERFVADGVKRNRVQVQPIIFEQRGRGLKAMSVSNPDGGRIRM